MENEIWKPIPSCPGYMASNLGHIRGKMGWVLVQSVSKGYLAVTICKDGAKRNLRVHRLVAEAFLGASDLLIDHINGVKNDNRLENLRYVTKRENTVLHLQKKKNLTGSYREKGGKRWFSKIYVAHRVIRLGTYATQEEAHRAYVEYREKNGL